jgi:hypothetical protein
LLLIVVVVASEIPVVRPCEQRTTINEQPLLPQFIEEHFLRAAFDVDVAEGLGAFGVSERHSMTSCDTSICEPKSLLSCSMREARITTLPVIEYC